MSRKRRVLFRIIRVLYGGNNHINIYMRLAGNGGKCYIGKVPLELPEAEEKEVKPMEWLFAVVILVPAAFVWYIAGGSLYKAFAKAREKSRAYLTCAIDADCPPGQVCINGKCQTA